MADGCCVDWSFNQRVDIHDVFVTIRVCRDRPLLCQSRQPPTCFSGLCKPHWGYSRACHGRTKSQDRLRTFLSLDLDVFVFSCIFIFFRAILRFSYIILSHAVRIRYVYDVIIAVLSGTGAEISRGRPEQQQALPACRRIVPENIYERAREYSRATLTVLATSLASQITLPHTCTYT